MFDGNGGGFVEELKELFVEEEGIELVVEEKEEEGTELKDEESTTDESTTDESVFSLIVFFLFYNRHQDIYSYFFSQRELKETHIWFLVAEHTRHYGNAVFFVLPNFCHNF